MTLPIAYHASHEQFAPSELLKLVMLAEEAGFDAIHSSDHFFPWSERQGQSGHSFCWLGAAMQASRLPFSVVCAPGPRYHPAVIAQAAATLSELFPGRFSLELGSGEALNEWMTGQAWPSKAQRNERLREAAAIIKRLLRGEEVSHEGLVTVREAKLYTLPAQPPLVFGAAITETTAGWCGQWAEGLLTTANDIPDLTRKIQAFHDHGGSGKPVFAQYAFSFHPDQEEAINGAYDQWRSNLLPPDKLAEYPKPEAFDKATAQLSREEVSQQVTIVTTAGQLFDHIDQVASAGASRIILHNVNRHQELFLQHFRTYRQSRRLITGLECL